MGAILSDLSNSTMVECHDAEDGMYVAARLNVEADDVTVIVAVANNINYNSFHMQTMPYLWQQLAGSTNANCGWWPEGPSMIPLCNDVKMETNVCRIGEYFLSSTLVTLGFIFADILQRIPCRILFTMLANGFLSHVPAAALELIHQN
jgi:hypothetical protein